MTHPRFELPDSLPLDQAASELGRQLGAQVERPSLREFTWADSFDWRLWAHGSVLCLERGPEGGRLIWRGRKDGAALAALPCEQLPRWPSDLPLARPRAALAQILEMRALLPVVVARGQAVPLRVVDERDKTTVRLELVDLEVIDPTGGVHKLGRRLLIEPLRGYEAAVVAVIERVEGLAGAVEPTLLEEALALLGRKPGDYSGKVSVQLRPTQRSDKAAKQLLLHLMQTMLRNEEGVRADLDSEFLHDFRVAVRRMRSALSQVRGVFPKRVVRRFAEELRWLGEITGPTRDLDVYLLSLPGFAEALPGTLGDRLEPLRELLARKQRAAHAELVQAMGTQRYRDFCEQWTAFLQADVPLEPEALQARTPILELAIDRISSLHQAVLDEGLAISADSPAEALHDLRKTCKKLRYALEFFRSLFDESLAGACVKDLKLLQDDLGAFQDLEVQANTLTGCSRELLAEGNVPAEALMAIGVLVEHLRAEQAASRLAFAGIFETFASKKVRRRFADLVGRAPA
jgi:CHAD domain-containing protein